MPGGQCAVVILLLRVVAQVSNDLFHHLALACAHRRLYAHGGRVPLKVQLYELLIGRLRFSLGFGWFREAFYRRLNGFQVQRVQCFLRQFL